MGSNRWFWVALCVLVVALFGLGWVSSAYGQGNAT